MGRFVYLFFFVVALLGLLATNRSLDLLHTFAKNKQTKKNLNKKENRKFQPRREPWFASYFYGPEAYK